MSKQLSDVLLSDILPHSIKNDSGVSSAASAVDPQLRFVAGAVDYPILLKRIDSLSSVQLDHLARQYDATWRDSWTVSLKRSILKATISNKRIVGTIKAVRNALEAISSTAEIVEWWQPNAIDRTPHTFTIVATASGVEGGIDTDLQDDLIAQIDSAKPVRSKYTLRIQESLSGGFNAVGNIQSVLLSRISHI